MWWWVLTSPGVTRQPEASIRCSAGGSCPGPPTESTSPSRTATQPPAISVPASSTVATSVAPETSRSTGERLSHAGRRSRWCRGRPARSCDRCRRRRGRPGPAAGPRRRPQLARRTSRRVARQSSPDEHQPGCARLGLQRRPDDRRLGESADAAGQRDHDVGAEDVAEPLGVVGLHRSSDTCSLGSRPVHAVIGSPITAAPASAAPCAVAAMRPPYPPVITAQPACAEGAARARAPRASAGRPRPTGPSRARRRRDAARAAAASRSRASARRPSLAKANDPRALEGPRGGVTRADDGLVQRRTGGEGPGQRAAERVAGSGDVDDLAPAPAVRG